MRIISTSSYRGIFFNIFLLVVLQLQPFQGVDAQTLSIGFEGAEHAVSYLDKDTPINFFVKNATGGALTRLVTHKEGKPDFVFDLADQLIVSPDNLTWSFRLKRGALFHDEIEVTSVDVGDSIKRCRKEGRLPLVDKVDIREVRDNGFNLHVWIDIKVKEDTGSELPKQVSFCHIYQKYLQDLFGSDWGSGNNIISSGPYYISDFRTGFYLNLDRFDSYSGRRPVNDRIILRHFKDSNQGLAALRLGTLDALFTNDVLVLSKAVKDETLFIDDCLKDSRVIKRRGLRLSCSPNINFDQLRYE